MVVIDKTSGRLTGLRDHERADRLAGNGSGFLDQPFVSRGDAGEEPCVFGSLFPFTRCGGRRHI